MPMIKKNLLRHLFPTKTPKFLYHYTNSTGMKGIIESGKIWATKIQYLNDKSEFRLAFSYLQDEIEKEIKKGNAKKTKQELKDMLHALEGNDMLNVAVISFSEVGDQLSQWRGYTQIGDGYALGFNGQILREVMELNKDYTDSYLLPCVYTEKEQRALIRRRINLSTTEYHYAKGRYFKKNEIRSNPSFEYSSVVLAALIKSDGFKEEKEWRFIYQGDTEKGKLRAGKHSLIPYWELNLNLNKTLKKILVGPTPEPELSCEAVWDLLVQKGLTKLTQHITSSKVPYRVV